MASTFENIIRKTGRKPISCKCNVCKSQCSKAPCLGTPQDILKLVEAGYADKIKPTYWAAGIIMRCTNQIVAMYQIEFDSAKGSCVLFKNGLCELHDKGLKPTEGRLSHHTIRADNYDVKKSVTWNVAKEWMDNDNKEAIEQIGTKLLNEK